MPRVFIRSSQPILPFDGVPVTSAEYWAALAQFRARQIRASLAPIITELRVALGDDRIRTGAGGAFIDVTDTQLVTLHRNPNFLILGDGRQTITPSGTGLCLRGGSPDLWHLRSIGVADGNAGKGCVVGVIDSGAWLDHKELAGHKASARVVRFEDIDPVDVPTSQAADAPGGHGTEVCSLLAGETCGVAREATLAICAMGARPAEKWFAAAIDWIMTTRHASDGGSCHVLNMSFGLKPKPKLMETLYLMLHDAWTQYHIVCVAGVGNAPDYDPGWHRVPGRFDFLLSVGATDRSDWVIGMTAWGQVDGTSYNKPDLCAPGADVWVAGTKNDLVQDSGTSLATPIVAGAVARLLSHRPELARQPDAVKQHLMASTKAVKGSYSLPDASLNDLVHQGAAGTGILDAGAFRPT